MSIENWWNDYRGIPYAKHGYTHEGCNCWGLVALVYHDHLGIDLPHYDGTFDNNEHIAFEEICGLRDSDWVEVDTPKEFDVVLFSVQGFFHVGVVFNARRKRFIHCFKDHHVCCESYGGLAWRSRLRGIWRHKDVKQKAPEGASC